MPLELLNAAVVVVVRGHNPSILHPSFLEAQGIVPNEWELAEQPVCTPPLSIVKYQNGVTFTADSAKLQVQDNNPAATADKSQIQGVAVSYILTLPHVRHTAVGVNFTGAIPCDEPARALLGKFLTRGAWHGDGLNPEGVALRLVYPEGDALLQLTIDAGQFQRAGEDDQVEAVIVRSNFHTDLPEDSSVEEAVRVINLYGQRYERFLEIVAALFEVEE